MTNQVVRGTNNTFADIESFKRLFLYEEVSAAKQRYGEAWNIFNALKAQLNIAVADERAARVAERMATEPRNQYNAAMLRSKRARDTFDLFVASRGKGKNPAATEGGDVTTSASSSAAAGSAGTALPASAATTAVAGGGRPQGGAEGGGSMSAKERFSPENSSAPGAEGDSSVMDQPGGDPGEVRVMSNQEQHNNFCTRGTHNNERQLLPLSADYAGAASIFDV